MSSNSWREVNERMEKIKRQQLSNSYTRIIKEIYTEFALEQDVDMFKGKISALAKEIRNQGFQKAANGIEKDAEEYLTKNAKSESTYLGYFIIFIIFIGLYIFLS